MHQDRVKIRRAILSVSDRSGIVELASALHALGVELVSTGGTAGALREAGLPVRDVAALTAQAEMLDGRVKTLHPAIHAGILADLDNPAHAAEMKRAGFAPIDLVVVNLYPFRETVAGGADTDACVDQIDIGGTALLRAAAKNHRRVLVLSEPGSYAAVVAGLKAQAGCSILEDRRRHAARAYAHTALYDAAVAGWAGAMWDGDAAPLVIAARKAVPLRYGENPHQSASAWRLEGGDAGLLGARQLQGKALSYNNLIDAEAAFRAVAEFDPAERAACVIVKHATPCGAALGADGEDALRRARSADETSAFGGIAALNAPLDAAAATALAESFFEVVIAPQVTEAAAAAAAGRSALRVLEVGRLPDPDEVPSEIRSLTGGLLVQDGDRGRVDADALRVVTRRTPSAGETESLLFAWRIAKHARSNAVVVAQAGATLGVGAGQTSRVDAVRQAVAPLSAVDTEGAPVVLASDGFFPFADGVETAAAAGVSAVIQPGGSRRDAEVIAAADAAGIAMVFTGMRHFRH